MLIAVSLSTQRCTTKPPTGWGTPRTGGDVISTPRVITARQLQVELLGIVVQRTLFSTRSNCVCFRSLDRGFPLGACPFIIGTYHIYGTDPTITIYTGQRMTRISIYGQAPSGTISQGQTDAENNLQAVLKALGPTFRTSGNAKSPISCGRYPDGSHTNPRSTGTPSASKILR